MMVLVTGGSGSGKSAFAEEKVLSLGEARRIYIATMFPFDPEAFRKIDRHRILRCGKGFETVECYTNLKDLVLPRDSVALLECMSNLTANEMFQEEGAHENTVEDILAGVRKVLSQVRDLVIVTNEIFSEAAVYEGGTGTYQRYLGEINQALAEMADEVTEVVYGIPVCHKGGTCT
ncbi:MAG: bifunctional adenosylcobinamide kinase/adenosylcobinamide-phosphate guanylyltransferase [Eubacteriales bacterium]|nr:bifunctional adenosylcobinamide kinase/adenosylcobinamide-phosphate guanylyltransferase [Eubacteriales bacterium]